MIITAICPECGDIIEEQECQSHPDQALLIYESENEAFVGEALMEYMYGWYINNTSLDDFMDMGPIFSSTWIGPFSTLFT